MDDDFEQKNQAGRAFGYIVVFAMSIQAAITMVWYITGTPSVQLPTPILSLLFLIMLCMGMVGGVKAVAMMKIEPLHDPTPWPDLESEKEED